jgi:DNA-binding NarL/FixJ family response regulator
MSLRILIVDDHAVVRRGLRVLLESHEGREVCGEATPEATRSTKADDFGLTSS